MRVLIMRVLIVAGLTGLVLAAPASAQVERLPEQSRAERQAEDINRSMQRQQLQLRENQQSQFEINQMRNDLQQSRQFPSVTGPGSGVGCPPGSVGC
jgi:hypothetical protein